MFQDINMESIDNIESSFNSKSASVHQRRVKIVEGKFPSSPSHRIYDKGKSKVKDSVDSRDDYLSRTTRRNKRNERFIKPKTSRESQMQYLDGKDDELIKYMSNLPGYLQGIERGEAFKGKALNVGVLDWARLEKWKQTQKNAQGTDSNVATYSGVTLLEKSRTKSSSTYALVFKDTPLNKIETDPSSSSPCELSRGLRSPVPMIRRFQELESASKGILNEQRKISSEYRSTPRNKGNADVEQVVSSGKGNLSSNIRNHRVVVSFEENTSASGGETKKRVKEKGEELNAGRKSDVDASSSNLSEYGMKLGFRNDEIKKRDEELKDSHIDLIHRHQACERRIGAQNSHPDVYKALLDANLNDVKSRSFRDDFLYKKVHKSDLSSQILHSCPLSDNVDSTSESKTLLQGLNRPSNASEASLRVDNPENLDVRNTSTVECSRTPDQEINDAALMKGRHPSPNRRFSLSFSRMRSLSFKEGSAAPQLSSTHVSSKSGPVGLHGSACPDGSKVDKQNGHSRTRSSPLRRILDPIFKSKAPHPVRSTETVQQPNGGAMQIPGEKLLPNQDNPKYDTTIRALLQITLKNGLPLYQFVVDNNSSILAATIKKSAPAEKDESCRHYTFYSVSEAKKKSGSWMSHGSKGKNCGFVYNVVGQMKLSSSDIVRESVLFDSESRHPDETSQKLRPCRELAAIVIKVPCENMMENDFTESLLEDQFSCSFRGKKETSAMTVILPGGVHSFPDNGGPSPLIQRWKSGGLCDCGGWDIGCKLHVLSDCKDQSIPKLDEDHLNSDSFELFDQGVGERKTSLFLMVPLKKGLYSVEFKSPITLLEAFFICVTFSSCQKSCELSTSEANMNRNDELNKTPSITGREMPGRYATNPPLSPFGRV